MSTSEGLQLSPSSAQQYNYHMKEGKELAASGMLIEAMESLKKAVEICPTKKALTRIKKLEEFMKDKSNETENNAGDEKMIEVAPGFYIYCEIYNALFSYQREGVAWMYGLFKRKKGGVLGDDMGLGKTFQVIAFLSGMIDANLIKHILIIMPVSLLRNWKKEFAERCPGINVFEFHGQSKKQREQNASRVQRRGGVLITSYGMVVSNVNILDSENGHSFIWDYVILDEGHKIKNPTKTTKAVHEIPARNRIVLTGTPVQNNLRELWALYDFTHHGTLLGSQKTFKLQYETPITRSREKDATFGERELGNQMAESLRRLIKPYFLRRTKEEVLLKNKNGEKMNGDVDELNKDFQNMKLSLTTRKNDFIMWLFLSKAQQEIYRSFLQSETVKKIFVDKRSPLVELTVLKKICDHPRLLSIKACMQLGLDGKMSEEELIRHIDDERSTASSIENVSDGTLINESGKMAFTIELLEHLKNTGHRTLVFSSSRKILDMIQRILVNKGWKIQRIDGTISKTEERQKRILSFQNDSSYPVFLLTTQVGGVGLTLTAADRVIIYDPSWNPATDAQAVDRVYRIGQLKNVVIYRLITCGTVEEKIYRNQIFKDSINRQTTNQVKDPHRYFSKQELRELFVVEDFYQSKTQEQLERLHSNERKTDTQLDEHIAYLYSMGIFGVSDHDLMFTKDIKDPTEDHDSAAISKDYIMKRVEMAQMLVKNEGIVIEEGLKQAGTYVKPFTLSIPGKKTSASDTYKPPEFPEIINLPLPKSDRTSNSNLKVQNTDDSVFIQSPMSKSNKSSKPIKGQNSVSKFRTNNKSSFGEVDVIDLTTPTKSYSPVKFEDRLFNLGTAVKKTPPRELVNPKKYNSEIKKTKNNCSGYANSDDVHEDAELNPKNESSYINNKLGYEEQIAITNPRFSKTESSNHFKTSSPRKSIQKNNGSFFTKLENIKTNEQTMSEIESFHTAKYLSPKENSSLFKFKSRFSKDFHNSVNFSNPKGDFDVAPSSEVSLSKEDYDKGNNISSLSNSLRNISFMSRQNNHSRPSSATSNESPSDEFVEPSPVLKANTNSIYLKTKLFEEFEMGLSDEETSPKRTSIARRKSCAKPRTTVLWSESDNNTSRSTCPSADTSEVVVADSEDDGESINNDNSPIKLTYSTNQLHTSCTEENENYPSVKGSKSTIDDFNDIEIPVTPNKDIRIFQKFSSMSPQVMKTIAKYENIHSDISAKYGSPRRITPIKLGAFNSSPRSAAFEEAIQNSVEISPPQGKVAPVSQSTLDETVSPIVTVRKKTRRRIIASDDSDDSASYREEIIEKSQQRKQSTTEGSILKNKSPFSVSNKEDSLSLTSCDSQQVNTQSELSRMCMNNNNKSKTGHGHFEKVKSFLGHQLKSKLSAKVDKQNNESESSLSFTDESSKKESDEQTHPKVFKKKKQHKVVENSNNSKQRLSLNSERNVSAIASDDFITESEGESLQSEDESLAMVRGLKAKNLRKKKAVVEDLNNDSVSSAPESEKSSSEEGESDSSEESEFEYIVSESDGSFDSD